MSVHQSDRFGDTFHEPVNPFRHLHSFLMPKFWKVKLFCCCNKSSILVTEIIFAMTTGFPTLVESFWVVFFFGPFIVQLKMVLIAYGPFPWLFMTSHGSRASLILLCRFVVRVSYSDQERDGKKL